MATNLPALSESEIHQKLAQLRGWQLDGKTIVREYVLGGFSAAAAFVSKIAVAADAMDHHPDVLIHRYKCVKITLWTHSRDGLTSNDFELAGKIDAIYEPSR